MTNEEVTLDVLRNNKFCILGTASTEAEPWVSPVAFEIDDQLNFYWASSRDTRHSKLLHSNPKLSLCVIDLRNIGTINYDKGSYAKAVYANGRAREIPYDELGDYISWRYPDGKRQKEDFDPAKQHRAIYQLQTEKLWCLAAPTERNGVMADNRVELDLTKVRKLI